MPDCGYCAEAFDDESAYLDHLAAEHEGELRAIDRRRIANRDGGDGGLDLSLGPVVLVGLLALSGALVVYVTFIMGGSGGGIGGDAPAFQDSVTQPTDLRSVHTHGPINVTIDGQELDFSRSRYQVGQTGADAFHFEGGDGSRYHVHAQRVTLEYGFETLGIGVTNGTLAFDGTTYNASEGDTVVYEVDGERVNPETYTLQEGDEVRVVADGA